MRHNKMYSGNCLFLRKKGFTLIEVMVAISILAIGILSFLMLSGVLIKSQSNSYLQSIALFLARERIDETMNTPFASLVSGVTDESNIVLSVAHPELNNLKAAFSRKTTIVNGTPSAGLKSITVLVSWVDSDKVPHNVTLYTAVMDF